MIPIQNFIKATADALVELFPEIPVFTEFNPQKSPRGHLYVDFVSIDTVVATDSTMDATLILRIDAVFPANVQNIASRGEMAQLSTVICGALTGWTLDVGEQLIPIDATKATGGNGDWVPILLTIPYADDLVMDEAADVLMKEYKFKETVTDE